MTERERFKISHKHLDLSETKDAWDRPIFAHSHVEAMWSGWKRALESRVLAERQPVAVIGRDWQLLWASPVSLKEIVDRHNLKIGTPLFAHPAPDDAKDAARYRWLKMQSPPYPQRQLMLSTPWGQWDAAIDATIQADKETK